MEGGADFREGGGKDHGRIIKEARHASLRLGGKNGSMGPRGEEGGVAKFLATANVYGAKLKVVGRCLHERGCLTGHNMRQHAGLQCMRVCMCVCAASCAECSWLYNPQGERQGSLQTGETKKTMDV